MTKREIITWFLLFLTIVFTILIIVVKINHTPLMFRDKNHKPHPIPIVIYTKDGMCLYLCEKGKLASVVHFKNGIVTKRKLKEN